MGVVGVPLEGCGTFTTNPATQIGPFPEIPSALLICSLDGPLIFGLPGLRGLNIYYKYITALRKRGVRAPPFFLLCFFMN